MRGLTILVAERSATRLRSALTMAAGHAALGGATRLFLDAAAVPLVRAPIGDDGDALWRDAGQPTLADLLDVAIDHGVRIILCQTGIAMIGASPADFDDRIETGGMIGVIATLGDDRLVSV